MAGKATHAQPRWQQRTLAAGDAAGQLDAAYDRLRRAAARLCRRRRDPVRQAEAATLAASVMQEAAVVLAGLAERLEQSENRRGDPR